jgi:hypothetical protein
MFLPLDLFIHHILPHTLNLPICYVAKLRLVNKKWKDFFETSLFSLLDQHKIPYRLLPQICGIDWPSSGPGVYFHWRTICMWNADNSFVEKDLLIVNLYTENDHYYIQWNPESQHYDILVDGTNDQRGFPMLFWQTTTEAELSNVLATL